MKKILQLTMSVLLAPFFIMAQHIDDAKQQIYYEQYKTAVNTLHAVLQADPGNAEAWYWLSQVYLHHDSTDALRNRIQHVPENVRNDPYYKVAYGHLLLQENKKDSAKKLFNDAIIKTKSKDVGILAAVAKAHINSAAGDANMALEILKKAIKRDKKNPALFTLMGDAHRKAGNGGEAYKAYQQALSKDAGYAAAFYKTGKIFVSQNNTELYLKLFRQAVVADYKYAPALYDLYYYYYFRDANKAMDYFNRYVASSDANEKNDYLYTDLLYLTKQYEPAIQKAQQLLTQKYADTMPRLYKLMAYSYLGLDDTVSAINWMNQYFSHEADSNLVVKDFETMANLYNNIPGKEDSAIASFEKAVAITKDTVARYAYYRKLADLYKAQNDYSRQAEWLGKFYENNARATNIDLFNLGVAHFKAEEYALADTVFGRYIEEYPEQGFGYYWRARTNTLLDSTMEDGLAIPYYNQLIGVIESKDTLSATHKKWLIQAYGYLAAWETNQEKDFVAAIAYLNKVLEIDPANKDAQRYITMLEKGLPDGRVSDPDN